MKITTSAINDSPEPEETHRVTAIDAFRGVLVALALLLMFGVPALREWRNERLVDQLSPTVWHGVKLVDFIEPGFLFLMGLSASCSVSSRRNRGESRSRIMVHLVKRCIGLYVIGFFLENWIPTYWPEIRWTGIYQRLAICNLCVGFFCCFADWSIRLGVASLFLINYGFAFEAYRVPPPSVIGARTQISDTNPYSMEYNLAAYIDQNSLPGRKYFGTWDRYSLLSILPTVVLTLLGSCSGQIFLQNSKSVAWLDRRLLLVCCCAILGFLMDSIQPVNSILMTPAFILLAFSLYGFSLFVLSQFVERSAEHSDNHSFFSYLEQLGRQVLPLMFIAHFVATASTVIFVQTRDSWWSAIPYLQTLIAIWSISGLFLFNSWTNQKNVSIRL